MDIQEIREKYNNGDYTYKVDIPKKVWDDHIFDEDLSVRRNRELVKEHNDNVNRMQQDKRKKQAEFDKQFTNDIVEYIIENYNLTEKQARKVESYVYQEHHSYMGDYFCYIDDFASFAYDIITCEED